VGIRLRQTARRGASTAAVIAAGVALAAAWSTPAPAQVYKWVDEHGVTNYGSSPPAQGKARVLEPDAGRVTVVPAPAAPDPDAARERRLLERLDRVEGELERRRLDEAASASASSESEARRRAACERDRRVDCDEDWRGVRFPEVIVVQRPIHRPPHLRPHPLPGKPKPLPEREPQEVPRLLRR
jgi:hypothetical protein